jgi:serine protease
VGAVANNGVGLAPINWKSPILNVRVMGKCGGALADIADGIRWAAGLPVPGIPLNARPARVINLSLSGQGACGPILQSAVTDALAAGAVVVAAAGNDNASADDRWPSNCNGVIAVAATSRNGSRAFYSNHGSRIAVAAPGGGFGGSIQILRNSGATTADPLGYIYGQQVGTSLATPHVSGTVSLMQAIAPDLTPAEIRALLEASARPFPTVAADPCTTATCGAGIVDAATAVLRAREHGVDVSLPPPLPPTMPPPGNVEPAPMAPPTAPGTPAPPPPTGAEAPPPVPVPLPGGWTAKDPEVLTRLLKQERSGTDAGATGVTSRARTLQ